MILLFVNKNRAGAFKLAPVRPAPNRKYMHI